MSLLTLAQEFARRQGIRVPSAVTSSTDETVLQIWGLLNEEVEELAERREWYWLRARARFNHINGTDYLAYSLSGLAGFKGVIPRTLWAEDIRLPVTGPVTPEQWQQMILLTTAPAQYLYRIYSGGLYIYPVPTDLVSTFFSFEYLSSYPVVAVDGTTFKAAFTADDDNPRMPSRMVMAGLRWRWKKEKQQAYAEELRAYETMIENEAGRETNPGDLQLDTPDPDSRVAGPGLLIPAGNWNQ